MRKNSFSFFIICLALCTLALTAKAQTYTPQIGDKVTTDGGIYIVKGENLISNPDFENGFTDWTSGSNAALSEDYFEVVTGGGPDGSNCLNAFGNGGSSSAAAIKTGWPVNNGSTYLFSCWAKRTSSAMSSNTQYSRLYLSSSQTATTEEIATLTYQADTWVQTEVVFTPADYNTAYTYCVANFGWLNNGTSFDCFFLGEVELSSELATATLEDAISDAELLLASTTEGDDSGEYTTETRLALQTAISDAKTILSTATAQTEINNAVTALNEAVSTYKEKVNPPFTLGVQYSFTNVASGDLVLSSGSGGTVCITEESNTNDMIFTFEVAPDNSEVYGYNLKDADGYYVYRSGSWDTYSSTSTDLTAANAIFQIVDYGEYVQIKNMGSGSVLGLDNITAGSTVYSNKNGTSNYNNWIMSKYVPLSERDDKYYYELTLESAQKTLKAIDSSLIGDDAFMYSSEAYDALSAAIATSQTMTDYAAARAYLETAIAEFEANQTVAPAEGLEYYITHVSGKSLYCLEDASQPVITTTDDSTVQSYTFETTDTDGAYAIRNVQTGYYMAKDSSSDWNTTWLTEASADEAKWIVTIYSDSLFTIKCLANSGCLGTDATSDGSVVYCDKSSSLSNAHWNVALAINLDFTAFDAAYETASAFLESMVEGYEIGQYFASDISAFSELLSETKTNSRKQKEQEDLDALAVQLLSDTETYRAKAHTTAVPYEYLQELLPQCQTECDAAVSGLEQGQYPQDVIDTFQTAINTASAATSDYASVVDALLAARETFRSSVMTVNRSTLLALINSAETALSTATVGDCDGQYTTEAISAYQTALSEVQTVYNNVSASQDDVDAAASAMQTAASNFAAARVTIDFSSLSSAITKANSAISDAQADMGDGPGKYPSSAFETLQTIITESQGIVGSTEVNQAAVDAQTLLLEEAIETFTASRRPNDYSELEAYLSIANDIYANMSATGAFSSYYLEILQSTIDKGNAALSSTSQDEIDLAVKMLERDTELFSDILTGIRSVSADLSYQLNGGVLSLHDLPAGTIVNVYDTAGRLLGSSAGNSSLSMSLSQGVYVVTVSRESYKVSIKIMAN